MFAYLILIAKFEFFAQSSVFLYVIDFVWLGFTLLKWAVSSCFEWIISGFLCLVDFQQFEFDFVYLRNLVVIFTVGL